ncbi:hypothetical protein MRB53_026432 [Persea americana]|uniref:Uncharacterized protein n=1 Tax=Persea americana TaxID=3435 RepID=A0ACC2LIP7_PERAE|nr:hypothetical protein MRB53_026432 [Persea americana]
MVFRRRRLPVAIAASQLVTYIPLPEERTWEKSSTCSSDGKLEKVMEDEEGLVQFLMQSKEIYQTNQHRDPSLFSAPS